MKLLIAEDDNDLLEALCALLEKNNFSVEAVNNGKDALNYGLHGNYDAIILDIMMPGLNGIEVLKKLREEKVNSPVMMLTAKTLKEDRINGYNSGADDYLPKPFDTEELIVRVKALCRRSRGYNSDLLDVEGLVFNRDTAILCYKDKEVRLSGKEYQLMELFMQNPGIVFSTDTLMDKIWGWNSDADVNVVWVHLSNLRKKLNRIESTLNIESKRGLGYQLKKND